MALEAIYGDDLVKFEHKAGLRYFQVCCFVHWCYFISSWMVETLGISISSLLQVYIRYDLHDGTGVCAKLSSANEKPKYGGCADDAEEHDVGPDEFSYTCNLEYLPPLILTCLLPKSYPSKEPPYFTVTAKWMDERNVSQLCEMLDTIWAEMTGQEVVYQWVEWIQNSSLLHLWFDGNIMLG
jgi:E3 ubiquitin-protein ligase RNF14